MNKKVLGAVLGSCLFLCGDCVEGVKKEEKNLVFSLSLGSKGGFRKALSDEGVGKIKLVRGSQSREERRETWRDLSARYDWGSYSFVDFFGRLIDKKSGEEINDDDIAEIKKKKNEKLAAAAAQISRENAAAEKKRKNRGRKGGVVKSSGSSVLGCKKEPDQSELKNAIAAAEKAAAENSVSGCDFSDVSDVNKLREIKGKIESGRYGLVKNCSCRFFERVVKLDVDVLSDDMLMELIDINVSGITFVSGVDGNNVEKIYDVFSNAPDGEIGGVGVERFVVGIGSRFVISSCLTAEDIGDVIVKTVKKEEEEKRKEEKESLMTEIGKRIGDDVAKACLKSEDNVEKYAELLKKVSACFEEGAYKKLYVGFDTCALEEKTKMFNDLLRFAEQNENMFRKMFDGSDYIEPMTALLALEYSKMSDGDDKMKIGANFDEILRCSGSTLSEKYNDYNKRGGSVDKYKEMFGSDLWSKTFASRWMLENDMCAGELVESLNDSSFATWFVGNCKTWVAGKDEDGEVIGLCNFFRDSPSRCIRRFVLLVMAFYPYLESCSVDSLALHVGDLCTFVKDNWADLNEDTNFAGQIAQASMELDSFGDKTFTEIVIQTVSQYIVDSNNKNTKIKLDGTYEVQGDGCVKVGDIEYDGGSFVELIACEYDKNVAVDGEDLPNGLDRSMIVSGFNKQSVQERQKWLNDIGKARKGKTN